MMQKQEFLELFEAAILAAKSAARGDGEGSSPAVSRCVDAMIRLREAPESLACELVMDRRYPQMGKSHGLFIDHENPRIQSEAKLLYTLWMRYLYATGRKQSPRPRPMVKKNKKCVEMKISTTTGESSNREKVREILAKSLSKVANEVVGMKERVVSCDSWSVAASVESAMFERLGSFEGPQKAKYRSFLFNMGDSSNPDLRRKVLFGEISGERLVTMKKEEMASNKIQMEVQKIKERARDKEENRMKSMMMFQSGSMIMT
ncbi:F-box/LRR-repeat protein [Raphanus sativus]|uniref:Transcription elongation factor TFIIS-like n=1 Tax=Raphanus sativus TaxID=3726 RepID=A0A6J0KBP9_RAPSA|nr:transcription elongation factor TFIIS-like [Raphanus sativus]KAJ4884025.1 F-box/LRR-repeat protein [Raphanus sativus]